MGPLIAAAGMGLSALQSWIESKVQKRNVDKTILANKEMAKYAYSKDLEMWQKNNEYNSPENQMLRLKGAGLNPNLVYGTGAVGNTSGQIPKYQSPQQEYNYKPPTNLPQTLSQFQDVQLRQAQIDNLKSQTANTNTRTVTEGLNAGLRQSQLQKLGVDISTAQFDLSRRQALAPSQQAIVQNQARTSEAKLQQEITRVRMMNQEEQLNELRKKYQEANISGVQIQNEQRQADLLYAKYRNQWMEAGITSSDNVFLRLMIRAAKESGLTLEDLNPVNWFKKN